MNRVEFIEQLERLLMDISQEEREDALAYYNSYFEDAGIEKEADVIRELGSPEKVAEIIKVDIGVEKEKEYTETGYSDTRFQQQEEVGNYIGGSQEETHYKQAETHTQDYEKTTQRSEAEKQDRTLKIALIILAAIVTMPLWGGILGTVLGIVGSVFGVCIAVAAMVVAFYIVSFAFIGVGISMFAMANVAAGLGLVGAGMFILAVAILGTIACIALYGKLLPELVRKLIALCKRVFHRKENAL